MEVVFDAGLDDPQPKRKTGPARVRTTVRGLKEDRIMKRIMFGQLHAVNERRWLTFYKSPDNDEQSSESTHKAIFVARSKVTSKANDDRVSTLMMRMACDSTAYANHWQDR